jgi:SPP1 gp7 family putative phage head morphogenesis protein
MADIYDRAMEYRSRLLEGETRATARVVAAYERALKRLNPALEQLTRDIQRAQGTGDTTNLEWLMKRAARLDSLEAQIIAELRRFGSDAASITTEAQTAAIELALGDATSLVEASAAGRRLAVAKTPGSQLAAKAVEALSGFATDGSPLAKLFKTLGTQSAAKVRAAITDGIILGYGADKIARSMRDAFGGDLTRALTITRTETLRAYREATRLTYAEHEDDIEGWEWMCARSTRTCAVCWAMHGSVHPLTEYMASHPNCRCVMIPVVIETQRERQSGARQFAGLTEEQQRAILGKGKFEAYREGKLKLEDLVGEHTDPRWGNARYQRTLGDVLAGKRAERFTKASSASSPA